MNLFKKKINQVMDGIVKSFFNKNIQKEEQVNKTMATKISLIDVIVKLIEKVKKLFKKNKEDSEKVPDETEKNEKVPDDKGDKDNDGSL